jgi:hypothetical protein
LAAILYDAMQKIINNPLAKQAKLWLEDNPITQDDE